MQVCYAERKDELHSKGCKEIDTLENNHENITSCDSEGCEYWCKQELCNNKNFSGEQISRIQLILNFKILIKKLKNLPFSFIFSEIICQACDGLSRYEICNETKTCSEETEASNNCTI